MQEDFFEQPRIASEALVRIEKAKLYQLLLQNNLFGEDAGDEEAVLQVTEEIKGFVLAKLETLMGMRSETASTSVSAKLPWNQQQISALTELANRVIEKNSQSIISSPTNKPTVNTISKPVKSSPVMPKPERKPTAPAVKQPVLPKQIEPPKEKKAGDDRYYSKMVDSPLKKPMPSAMEMQAMALGQVTSGLDFVSQGSSPEDAQKVGRLLLGNVAPSIEKVEQGID